MFMGAYKNFSKFAFEIAVSRWDKKRKHSIAMVGIFNAWQILILLIDMRLYKPK